nr:MAG TPA: nuclear pore complex protein [Caudoviricetes sp.]
MANCNCNDFPISCAPHAPGGDCCHPHGCPPHPHPFKGGTSMYIGARYVPIFADPVEWDDEREYEPLTIVTHNGDCYTSKCYVPKGAQLPPYPEGQTKYWVKTSDYNGQFADLKKTVLDLSRLVDQFQKDNKEFTDLINGWNEKVQQWETKMTAWGERLDTVESHITDLTASLNAEIDRAKAAEQANAAAIAQETTDRKQAISELDAAYKAADAAEAQAREAGDAANAAAIAQETTDRKQAISELDAAYKAADTALSDRITANKTDIDALKAEQAIQNTNISKNAKNISDNAAEIAKHAARLTSLESNASDWDDVFPDTTIAQEVQKEELARANADTALNGRCDTIAADVEEVRDLANHKVDATTYTAEQAAQDTKINAAQAAADKANTNIGDWETDHPNQTISQCATSLENETTANAAKADANAAVIGDWNAEHPGKTIAQEVTRLNGAIPDVSGFVTETTYNQGQAAQDSKITAAQTAANKANTNIGDWDAQHPGKTIAQAVTDAGYLDFLNDLYPQGSVIPGGSFYRFIVFPSYHKGSTTTGSLSVPVFVPDIVARFSQCWQPNYTFPTSIILHDAAGNIVATNSVVTAEIRSAADTPYLYIELSSLFSFPVSGIYYFEFSPYVYFGYSWTKNATPFPSLE